MELTTETLAGDVTKVNLAGKLDIAGAQKIDLHFSVLVGSHRKLIVDLEQVSFLASMGIRTLIMGAKTVKSKGGRMSILKPTPDVEKVLISCGADTLIPITHDLDAALAAVTG
jgi:anti-anti-sigma factor